MGKGYPEGLSTSLCNLGSISPSPRRRGERGHALDGVSDARENGAGGALSGALYSSTITRTTLGPKEIGPVLNRGP